MALLSVLGASGIATGASAVTTGIGKLMADKFGAKVKPKVEPGEMTDALEQATEAAPAPPDPDELPPAAPIRPQTSSGKAEALDVMRRYTRDLLEEASRIAHRVGAEEVSRDHVREAASRIGIYRATTSVVVDLMLVFGALVLGGPIAYVINLMTGAEAGTGGSVYLVIAAAVVGVALMATAATLKLARR